MQKLKLPEYDAQIRDGEVRCLVRKKWVVLTPEEWVRQHFLNLLINHLDYPRGMIQLEHSFSYFKNQKRSDITVLDRNGKVFLLVECKSTRVNLDESVVRQASQYNHILAAAFLSITNGINHFIWQKVDDNYEQITAFPSYPKGAKKG